MEIKKRIEVPKEIWSFNFNPGQDPKSLIANEIRISVLYDGLDFQDNKKLMEQLEILLRVLNAGNKPAIIRYTKEVQELLEDKNCHLNAPLKELAELYS